MHRILFKPAIRSAGYPANLKAGYRILAGYPAGYLVPTGVMVPGLTGYPVVRVISGFRPDIKTGQIIRPAGYRYLVHLLC
jgi:hypothetical protein